MNKNEKSSSKIRNEPITFPCEDKCRICPYPGANCKTISVTPVLQERDANCHHTRLDPESLDERLKKMRLK